MTEANNTPTPTQVGSTDVLGLEPERAAFEAWMSNHGAWTKAVERGTGGYVFAQTHTAWMTWQAAAAAERKRCAAKAAPEHIPFSDEEWRVRCEIRDAILEA